MKIHKSKTWSHYEGDYDADPRNPPVQIIHGVYTYVINVTGSKHFRFMGMDLAPGEAAEFSPVQQWNAHMLTQFIEARILAQDLKV